MGNIVLKNTVDLHKIDSSIGFATHISDKKIPKN